MDGKDRAVGSANSVVVYQRRTVIYGYDTFQVELAPLFMMEEIYVTVVVPSDGTDKTFKDL